MKYSESELKYARPLANAIIDDSDFRQWLLEKTEFEHVSGKLIPVGVEQEKLRSKGLKNPYWFNYWCGKDSQCMCRVKEGGIETDILIVLRSENGIHIAFHIEVKRPGDKLRVGQAESYPRRAACWANPDSRPRTVYPHQKFLTILACGRDLATDPDLSHFDRVVFHDEIERMIGLYPEP
jgi:hypothetical protein